MTVLFIHGLASSGAFKTAATLKNLLRPCEVISPDMPIDPSEAMALLEKICLEADPDLVVGHSMGGFLAQKLRGRKKILINPDFHISRLMRTMKGEVKYLSPRRDGSESFMLTEEICKGYEALEQSQFEGLDCFEKSITLAMFADHDEMVDCFDEYNAVYGNGVRYPGGHLPTFPEVKEYLLPLALKLLASGDNI